MSYSCDACLSGRPCTVHSWSVPNPPQQWPNYVPVPLSGDYQQGEHDPFRPSADVSYSAAGLTYHHPPVQQPHSAPPHHFYPVHPVYAPQNNPSIMPYSTPMPHPIPVAPAAPPKKRKASSKAKSTAKRPRTLVDQAGIGPSIPPNQPPLPETPLEPPASHIPIIQTTIHSDEQGTKARGARSGINCWALLIGTQHSSDPQAEAKEDAKRAALAHLRLSKSALRRPSEKEYPRLLCIICLTKKGVWKTWGNYDGGACAAPRKHFQQHHGHDYVTACHRNEVVPKNHLGSVCESEDVVEEINQPGLARYFAEFVAEQDLAFNIVNAPSFRRLLCYVGQNNITASMIPERRVVAHVVSDLSEEAKKKIAKEMQDAEGRVSITSDLWTDEIERPFMAVTGHYETKATSSEEHNEEELAIKLLAFRFVEGSHTGENLGKILFGILSEYNILHKIGSITLDNASNNDTMMQEMQELMETAGHAFHREGNRISCFPHVINLAVNDFLDNIVESAHKYYELRIEKDETPSDTSLKYIDALKTNLVKRVHDAVVALRHGQRRRAVKATCHEGNEKGWWNYQKDKQEKETLADGTAMDVIHRTMVEVKLTPLELILDVRTRWGSTRGMVDRYIYLHPVVDRYIYENLDTLSEHIISRFELKVLKHIAAVLDIAHDAQALLSSEQTPTLSLTFPVYESLICRWNEAATKYSALGFAINVGVEKIKKYVCKARSSRIHILSMFLNPSVKYSYIDKHWELSERQNSRTVVKGYMMEYAKERDRQAEAASSRASIRGLTTNASSALGRGLGRITRTSHAMHLGDLDDDIGVTPPRRHAGNTASGSNRPPETPTRPSVLSSSSLVPSYDAAQRNREMVVELEHDRYLGLPDSKKYEDLGKIDLVKYWNIQSSLPLLRAISKDVLPAQATSVSSERIFSSSKLTCTRARNKISIDTVEKLQVLKHTLRHSKPVPTVGAASEADLENDMCLGQQLDIMQQLGHEDWGYGGILDSE